MSSVSARTLLGMVAEVVVCGFSRSPRVFFLAAGGTAVYAKDSVEQQLMHWHRSLRPPCLIFPQSACTLCVKCFLDLLGSFCRRVYKLPH